MVLSRGVGILKTAKLLNSTNFLKTTVRNSHAPWSYRAPTPIDQSKYIMIGEVVQGFMWWWMLYHLWIQYDHITGEFEYPDASKWTDEELGIPSD